ncbi:MAG: hypothetical protein K5898_02075 [Ruminococcus sp.]|uniref:hypothetical protein n=1 Tax=Ruminococcus sp. TaxID=41978 RepID=UPI0025F43F7F|nr:hypothetical protein [Ruminococcus sp.]MCR4793963.1 hypothetical protein [Ruminococcus sp.]
MSELKNFTDGMPAVKNNRKEPNPVIGLIMIVIIAAFSLFMGISGLKADSQSLDDAFSNGLNSGAYVSGEPAFGANKPNFVYKHTVNFIPIVTEYYYIILSEDEQNGVLVRADKDFGKNFDSSTFENISGIKIKGKVKASKSKILNSTDLDQSFLTKDMYIDMLSRRNSFKWLYIGVLFAVTAIYAAFRLIRYGIGNSPKTAAAKLIGIVLCIASCVAMWFFIQLISLAL